jgi:hypothetical protein
MWEHGAEARLEVAGPANAAGAAAGVLRAVCGAVLLTALWMGVAAGQSRSGTIRVSAVVPDIAQLRVIGTEGTVTEFSGGPALRVTSGRGAEIGLEVDAIEQLAAGGALPRVLTCALVAGVADGCRTRAVPTGRLWSGAGNREVLVGLLPVPVDLAGANGPAPVRLTVAYTAN